MKESRPAIHRDEHGIPHVRAGDEIGLYRGLGFCHARDRGVQMLLMRILGLGRAGEVLDGGDGMLRLDHFFRRMNWSAGTAQAALLLPEPILARCQAYCEGVNSVLARKTPWELRLLGYHAEPWTVADCLLLSRLTSYVGLAQSQARAEQFLVELVQAGVRRTLLDELFPGILDGLDEGLIRKVCLAERIVPEDLAWNTMLPKMVASNNWVVSASKTASGKPMLANDPHLEVNRLPAVWYEVVLCSADQYVMGATIPGLPAVIIGRTPDLSWGVTYAFVDAVDSWIEHCRDGKCLREGGAWVPFVQRTETIRRKGRAPVQVTFHENEHGSLYGDPHTDGYYLATRWAAADSGPASVAGFAGLWNARSVEEGMRLLGNVESAWAWVLADREGNIGFQMSGLTPRRRAGVSGFVPLPGWHKENDWQGFVSPEDMPRCLNPASGYFVTANNNLNAYGVAAPSTITMASCRADRIAQVLASAQDLTPEDMSALQYDVHSLQAEAFMGILRPLLPDTPQAQTLREWNCQYDSLSPGATLFENFYRELLLEVFGVKTLGESVADFLYRETAIFSAFFGNFDRILLSPDSSWFGGESRDAIYRRAAQRALVADPRPWGESRQIRLVNMFFQGKLPAFLGFDRGPVKLHGGRATVCQSQIFRSGGRSLAVSASFRMIADMGSDEIRTNLCGGPSDRRFSRWYASDLPNWEQGIYKRLRPGPP